MLAHVTTPHIGHRRHLLPAMLVSCVLHGVALWLVSDRMMVSPAPEGGASHPPLHVSLISARTPANAASTAPATADPATRDASSQATARVSAPAQTTTPARRQTSQAAPASPDSATANAAQAIVTVDADEVLRERRPPHYPALARRRGWEGTVQLRARIDRRGRVTEVEVLASAGKPVLDEAAIDAVRRWLFNPVQRGGFHTVAWVNIPPIRFQLN